jgi:hypothetical protein
VMVHRVMHRVTRRLASTIHVVGRPLGMRR